MCNSRKYWQTAKDKQSFKRDASKCKDTLTLGWCLMRKSVGFAVLQDGKDLQWHAALETLPWNHESLPGIYSGERERETEGRDEDKAQGRRCDFSYPRISLSINK